MTATIQKSKSMRQKSLLQVIWEFFTDGDRPYAPILRFGALAGLALLYVGLIGMIEAFHERDIIPGDDDTFVKDAITLGQILLFTPAFLAGYFTSRKIAQTQNPLLAVLGGGAVGLLTAVPSLFILALNSQSDMRDMFVNVNRDWIEIITFDRRDDLFQGGLLLTAGLTVAGLVGGILSVLPNKIRQSLIFGLSLSLLIGVLGETVRLILQENFSRDVLDNFFRRDVMLLNTAIGLFVLGTLSRLFWLYFGNQGMKAFRAQTQKTPQINRTVNLIALGLMMAVLLVLPFVVGRALSDVMVTIGLFVLMGFGLNIAIGLAGLLDLGYVTNYAVGAYIMAVLTSTGPLGLFNNSGDISVTFWMVIPVAILAAMFAGFIFAVPVLKMRGDYLAIATLGFGEIIGRLAVSDALKPTIGGAQGVVAIPNAVFFGTELKNPEQLYYVILAACVITLIVSIRLNNSRTGRQWMAIREDEDVAAAMGIDTARAKLLAFTLSAATGGLAGAIFATKVGTVFPNSFTVFVSINVLSLIIVGGMGSNPGIVLGAIVLIGLPELLREFSEFRWLMYGVLLVWMMINRPEGLFPSQVTRREMHDPTTTPMGGD